MVSCADGTFYTGISTDVDRRLRQHNGELVGGARYTAARRPVALVYKKPSLDRSSASREEYQIRRLSRVRKRELIAQYAADSDKIL